MTSKPTTVEEYIATAPRERRERLIELRALALENAPGATEGLKWNSPAYWTGTILFVFSGHSGHSNVVFTPSTLDEFRDELEAEGFELGKGSVRVPHEREVPRELLGRMITRRLREWEENRVTWK